MSKAVYTKAQLESLRRIKEFLDTEELFDPSNVIWRSDVDNLEKVIEIIGESEC